MEEAVYFGTRVSAHLDTTAQEARHLESLGYDFLSVGEHVMQGNPPRPSTMAIPVLGVAAGATERVRLVASVLLVPLYHPVLLAKLLSVLDRACGGRLVVGVGVGGEIPIEFQAVGVPVRERGRRADEALDILRRLWTQEHVTHNGRFYQFQDVTLSPPPAQKPHPPLWVAGRREPAMRRPARFGTGWYPHLYSPEQLRSSIERIKEMGAEVDRDLSGFQWGVQLYVVLDDSPQKAAQIAVDVLGSHFRYGGDWRDIVERYCLLGTPDDCARRLHEYIEVGAQYIGLHPMGEAKRETEDIETLARDVVPRFRP